MDALRFLLLFLLEWILKFASFPAILVALGTAGSFSDKLFAGLLKPIPVTINFLWNIPENLRTLSDYFNLTAAEFSSKYGSRFSEFVGDWMTQVGEYLKNMGEPSIFISVLAATCVFCILFSLGHLMRFARQKGRGSWIHRNVELPLGRKIWKTDTEI